MVICWCFLSAFCFPPDKKLNVAYLYICSLLNGFDFFGFFGLLISIFLWYLKSSRKMSASSNYWYSKFAIWRSIFTHAHSIGSGWTSMLMRALAQREWHDGGDEKTFIILAHIRITYYFLKKFRFCLLFCRGIIFARWLTSWNLQRFSECCKIRSKSFLRLKGLYREMINIFPRVWWLRCSNI